MNKKNSVENEQSSEFQSNDLLRLNYGYIYKIYNTQDPEFVYIGSTTSSLKDRLNGHKRSYKRYKQLNKGYLASFEIFEKYNIKNTIIEKVDELYFKENKELIHLEGKWQRKIKCINIVTNNDSEKIREDNVKYEKYKLSQFDIENNPFKEYSYVSDKNEIIKN